MVTFDSTDLDNAVSESGVVHESVTNTDHDNASVLKQGYSIENPYLSSNLVGYWPLQEDSGSTAYDFSGNGNDGSITGATVNQTGLLGTSSYSFDGTDDYITESSAVVTSFPLSISMWIKTTDASNIPGMAIIDDTDHPNREIGMRLDTNGEVGFDIYSDGSNSFYSGSTTNDDGKWHHMAVICTNSDITGYVDGGSDLSTTHSKPFPAGVDSTIFGIFRQYDNANPYKGSISDVRIYDRALTASEVQTLYDVVNTSGTLTTGYKSV